MEQEENKKKILLVDDEPINHKIVQFLMKAEAEYEILGADGGRQAAMQKAHTYAFVPTFLFIPASSIAGLTGP